MRLIMYSKMITRILVVYHILCIILCNGRDFWLKSALFIEMFNICMRNGVFVGDISINSRLIIVLYLSDITKLERVTVPILW